MPENIIILKGSPRVNGNTATLANQVAAGAKESGAEVESFDLHNMNIQPCDACDTCQETGVCIINDDMQTLYPKIGQADSIVIASPVYWFTITAQMKLCIDRWYAFESEHVSQLKGKKIALVLPYGDTDLYTSGGINAVHTIEAMCRYLGIEFAGIVHGTAMDVGDAEKQPALLEDAFKLGQKLATYQ
ncbi:MAG: flavodoxin family protein [Anaerolineales bacterium]|nr:flavodoxin family protein [Chloroflexota bacterium]MBL6982915.1 flavodoxin family protein [Anaerolineales bacterium]